VVKCEACGFVYVQNPVWANVNPQNYDAYYKNAAIIDYEYQNKDTEGANSWNIYNRRIGLIRKILPHGQLLEIGCGRGYFLHLAKEYGYKVNGIEISPIAAQFAKSNYNIDVQTGDIEIMDISDTSINLITLWHVLEHFYNPLAVLQKVYKMLNTGGILIVEVPNLHSLKFQLANEKKRWQSGNHPRYHLSFFTMRTLKKMLQKTGFKDIKTLHINYSGKKRFLLSGIKGLLNTIHVDSFLTLKAVK